MRLFPLSMKCEAGSRSTLGGRLERLPQVEIARFIVMERMVRDGQQDRRSLGAAHRSGCRSTERCSDCRPLRSRPEPMQGRLAAGMPSAVREADDEPEILPSSIPGSDRR